MVQGQVFLKGGGLSFLNLEINLFITKLGNMLRYATIILRKKVI